MRLQRMLIQLKSSNMPFTLPLIISIPDPLQPEMGHGILLGYDVNGNAWIRYVG